MALRLREKIASILHLNDSPHKIALSFAVGVFVGVSPLLGVHVLLGVAAAYVFRLNNLATMSGVLVTNPISLVPIYTFCIWFGGVLLGVDVSEHVKAIDWSNIGINTIYHEFEVLLMPFVVGTLTVGFITAVASYAGLRYYIQRLRADRIGPEDEGGGS